MSGLLQCEDFMLFQKALKQLRDIDDKIVYALNLSTPTSSIQAREGAKAADKCLELQQELDRNYSTRESGLSNCILVLGEDVKTLKKDYDSGDYGVISKLRSKQSLLRMMKNELNVEEIIRDRSRTIFSEKCKEFLP